MWVQTMIAKPVCGDMSVESYGHSAPQQCHFIDWHCCAPAPSKPDAHLPLAHDPLALALEYI